MRLKSDLSAVRLIARYARRLARVAVLRPSATLTREFRAVMGPSFYCLPKLVWDQDGVPFDKDGNPCPHPPPCDECIGASVLRLQFWPVRIWLVDAEKGAADGDPPSQCVSLRRLDREHRRPTAEALCGGSRVAPACIVDVRNRYSASLQLPPDERLSDKGRGRLRRLFSPQKLKDEGPEAAFLRERSLYVAEWTRVEEVMAELAIALAQYGVVEQDSDLNWWLDDYLGHVHLKGVSPRKQHNNEIRAEVFGGMWRNWGDHDRAGAFLKYLGSWFQRTRLDPQETGLEPGSDPDDHRDTGQFGELPPRMKHRRDTQYAVPPEEPLDPAVPVSLDRAATVLDLSPRQVRRLAETGELQPLRGSPLRFAAKDVERLRDQRLPDSLERRRRRREIGELVRQGKKLPSARKAEYRQRKRRQTLERGPPSRD